MIINRLSKSGFIPWIYCRSTVSDFIGILKALNEDFHALRISLTADLYPSISTLTSLE